MIVPHAFVITTPTAASSSDANGSEAQAKRRRLLLTDANRAETYRHGVQPGRVPLHLITWHASNRAHQGIMPLHAHAVAENISTHGTSLRRYKEVKLVEVPDTARNAWLAANEEKVKHNTLLANFSVMSQNGTMYACLSCTHFVEAQKLILEGHRTHMDEPDGHALKLNEEDDEGNMIQSMGVQATVYTTKLWDDAAAILSIMQEDNAFGTELDAFGHVSYIVGTMQKPIKSLSVKQISADLGATTGYGRWSATDWDHLIGFRLVLGTTHANMLLYCLFQVWQGRIHTLPKTYTDINKLHVKKYPWCKIFLLMQTYTE